MAAFLVVSMVGPTVVVADHYEEDQFVEASENVDVWERAAFAPLYVDYEGGNAETIVEHPEPVLATQDDDIGDAGLNRHKMGVWGTDQTIPLVFEDRSGATTPVGQFQDDQWDLVVARTDAGSIDLSGLGSGDSGMFQTQRALELLDQNADAEVEIADTRTFDEDSETFEYDPEKPGAYAFFLVNTGSVEVEDGDVTSVSNAKVIGVDTTVVQDAQASIEPEDDTYEPGEEITFDVSANHPNAGDEELFTHAVLLFNETDFVEADGQGSSSERLRLEFSGSAEDLASADASDFTLDTSYGAVHGAVRTDGDAEAFGIDFEERDEHGEYDVETLVDALLQEVDLNEMQTETGDSVLNASLTVICSTDPDTTVDVGTTENFAEGRYDVLYVAEGRETGTLSTARGDVTIGSEPVSTPGRGPPSWVPPVAPGPGPKPPVKPDPTPGPKIDVQPNQNAASIAFENVRANTRTAVDLPASVRTERASVSSIAINTTRDHPALDMTVRASDTVPEGGTPELDIGQAISYVEVTVDAEEDVEYNGAEFTFEVEEDTLEELGISEDRVRLFRYNEEDSEWQQLPTEHQGGTSYTATSPGFSVFAIGATQPSNLEVTDASVAPTEIEVGETVEAMATVENTGDEEDTFTVDFTVDGEVVDSTDVTLGPGESEDVAFEHTFDEAGSYDLAIGGASAGTVEVEESEDTGQPVEEGVVSPGLVLIVVLVLLVLGVGAAYYIRSADGFDAGR